MFEVTYVYSDPSQSDSNINLKVKDEFSPLCFERIDIEDEEFLVIVDNHLGLCILTDDKDFENNLDSLYKELYQYILFLWEEYAMKDDITLTKKEIIIKKAMLSTFEVV